MTALMYEVLSIVLGLTLVRLFNHRKRCPQPPGPKGLPLIGNLLDIPTSGAYLEAERWKEKYGDLVFVEALGKPYIFINSYNVAAELLERRSIKSSGRPQFTMAIDLEGWGWFLAFMPHGETWRKHSIYLHRFGSHSAINYHDIHAKQAHKLLGSLLRSPCEFFQHIEDYIGATIMMITYGHETKPPNDPYIALAKDGLQALADAMLPGKFIVEVIPWLKHIPSWFPGAEFQRIANEARRLSDAVRYKPYEMSKAKVLDGTAPDSITKTLIEEQMDKDGTIADEEVIANAAGTVYLAGSETDFQTVGTLLTFILAMLLYPEVQHRAQREIDEVVGKDRLPSLADRESLPYVNVVVDECLRWNPAAPVGVPHAQTEEDVYDGYLIPKGTTLVPNQWAMMQDSTEYTDPCDFRPERFLSSDNNGNPKLPERDPKKIAFGFGRRICPGQQVALDANFAAVSNVLACFEIKNAVDQNNVPIKINPEYTTASALRHPLPFKCTIIPRSEKARVLIEHSFDFA